MVMQEQSKAPTREKEWVKKNVFHPAAQLDSLRRLYAPKGKSVCYMTWGRNNDTYEGIASNVCVLAACCLKYQPGLATWRTDIFFPHEDANDWTCHGKRLKKV